MIKNALKWQTISSIVIFSLALLQVAVLARFLDLADFGLVAIIMVVINISQVLSDLGMANYLVYRQKISKTLNSTVFWICFFSGFTLFILLTLISPLIAKLYGQTEILYLLPLSAVSFIPISMCSQIQARYICEFRLNELAKIDVISKILGAIIAIWTAYTGIGAASILLGALATNVLKCLLIWLYAEKAWRPVLLFSVEEAKRAWQYGVYQIGSQLINQFRGNLDTLLLAFYIDNTQLGAYNLAKQLIQKPAAFVLPIIQKITLPLLASSQSDMSNMRLLIKKAHCYVSVLLLLPYVLLGVLAEQVVVLLYGTEKVEVAFFVIPLALFWMFRSIGGALVGSLVQGLGKTKIDFYWNLSVLGVFSLLCILLAPYGAYTLSWGLAILQLFLLNVIYFVFYKKIIQFKYLLFITPILLFSLLSFISVLLSTFFISTLSWDLSTLMYTIIVSSLSTCFYYIGCYYFQSDLIEVKSPYSLLKR